MMYKSKRDNKFKFNNEKFRDLIYSLSEDNNNLKVEDKVLEFGNKEEKYIKILVED